MPDYDYECACGEVAERTCKVADMPQSVKCKCGKRAPRKITCPAVQCRYSYMDRVNGNPRVNRGKGRR